MFKDIKIQMENPEVQKILSACVFDNSPGGMKTLSSDYHRHSSWQLFGWFENENLVGVCGYEVHLDWVEILHIATHENVRGCGVARNIVNALQKLYNMPIEAETDNDAVEFYQKCGFKVTAICKYNVQRFACVLS